MNEKAGQLFNCCCCGEDHDESEATHDSQLGGPVCRDCRGHLGVAVSMMKKNMLMGGETLRPMAKGDVNQHNFKRFQIK